MLTEITQTLSPDLIRLLRCPKSKQPLKECFDGKTLTLETDQHNRYEFTDSGIPLFAETDICEQSFVQQQHYEKMAKSYQENLSYPHTIEYFSYLDNCLTQAIQTIAPNLNLGLCVELCCGTGEAIRLFGQSMTPGIGIDISKAMLERGLKCHHEKNVVFIQGDATNVPLQSSSIENVLMLGGIHHVPDRKKLFSEINRILKPGGYFIYREPVSDFWLWRALRYLIYRFSPMLSHETERPLLQKETIPVLEQVGLKNLFWGTYGFFGFCIFMNSDVLWFNRFFRFIPGIKFITRVSAKIDHLITSRSIFKNAGLQVIGIAQKPGNVS